MSLPGVWPQILDFFGTPLVLGPSPGQLSGDAGLLPVRQFDQRIGLTRAFAEAPDDPRDPARTEHTFLELARARASGILAGDEDQNGHDARRHDPVFKLLTDRSPEDADLASQPTLSRFENANAHAALAADDDLAYLVTRLRRARPDVVLHFRGDCGFGVPDMYDVCEGLRVSYTFGLSANAILQRQTKGLLAEAMAAYERERQAARQQEPPRPPVPSRLFTGFWYQAGTWPLPRWVVAKAEANDRGTNRRFVVTNRPGALLFPGPTYDEYAARGESENRNKEFKCDLAMDRLSDHRFVANYFRLYLHAAAMNLLVRLRRFIAEPLPAPAPPAETAPPTSPPGESALPAAERCVPAEALTGAARQHHFRLRRQRDPLGEGHPCTWRGLLIKVASEVVLSTRRIVVRLSSSWPHLGWYHRVCERVRGPVPRPIPDLSG
jgi:hypothetical protein